MASATLKIVENEGEKISEQPWATWETFWDLYPKRVAKREAEKAWVRMSMGEREAAITVLPDWLRVWRARGDIQYVPHPASWLNGARWEDELPSDISGRPASQVPAKLAAVSEKSEMPDNVKAALAKWRKL